MPEWLAYHPKCNLKLLQRIARLIRSRMARPERSVEDFWAWALHGGGRLKTVLKLSGAESISGAITLPTVNSIVRPEPTAPRAHIDPKTILPVTGFDANPLIRAPAMAARGYLRAANV
jgi:hypothetical protein